MRLFSMECGGFSFKIAPESRRLFYDVAELDKKSERLSCSLLGLSLGNETLIAANLIRKAGASDLDWLDELVD